MFVPTPDLTSNLQSTKCANLPRAPRNYMGKQSSESSAIWSRPEAEDWNFVSNMEEGLDCYVDADFAGLWGCEDDQDPVSVRSKTGLTLTLFGCPILWSSKLQADHGDVRSPVHEGPPATDQIQD
jgi:hypothetical protein